jgi:hypothetical protein
MRYDTQVLSMMNVYSLQVIKSRHQKNNPKDKQWQHKNAFF